MSKKRQNSNKRKLRVRKKLRNDNNKLRLSVFKSNKYIYAQIIDDVNRRTLASANSLKSKKTGIDAAKEVGTQIAKVAKDAKISEVVFDRGSNRYHGRVKALAESARENGLDF